MHFKSWKRRKRQGRGCQVRFMLTEPICHTRSSVKLMYSGFADLAKSLGIPAGHIHANCGKCWTPAKRFRKINKYSMQREHLLIQPPTPTLSLKPSASILKNKAPTCKRQRKNPPSVSKGKKKARELEQSEAGSLSPLPSKSGNDKEVIIKKRAQYGTISKAITKSYSMQPGESIAEAYMHMLAQYPKCVCLISLFF